MIHIDKDWYIEVEDGCFTLQKYARTYTDKQGVERNEYTNQRYYATLKQAVLAYYKAQTVEVLRERDLELADALNELTDAYKSIENRLSEIIRG